jgi:hypothetical protein
VLEPLVAADAQAIDNPLAFGRYRWRIAREILALRGDSAAALSFPALVHNPESLEKPGPNLVDNSSFEGPPEADGLPGGRYSIGYPQAKEKPVGALSVTDEVAHSGRFSLKWDLSKVADAESVRAESRWLTANVGFSSDTVKSLRGKRVKVGYWFRLGDGATVPGLGLRQNCKEGPGEAFYYRGGVDDPAVWNHFQTEGRLSDDLESVDIHTWCTIPEAELAKKCVFYIDDVSLEVIEEPPLVISTPLDEYYSGESIPWTVHGTSSSGAIKIALLAGDRVVVQQLMQGSSGPLRGVFAGHWPDPGIYTLQATATAPQQAPVTAQSQVIVAPDPFSW